MEQKYLVSTISGKIINLFIPNVYDDELKGFIEDDEVEYIGIEYRNNNNETRKIIKKIDNNYKKMYVDLYNLDLTIEEKEKKFNDMVVSEEEFNIHPRYIIDYELIKEPVEKNVDVVENL